MPKTKPTASKKVMKQTVKFRLSEIEYKSFRFANMRACFSDCTFSRDDKGVMTVNVKSKERFAEQFNKEMGYSLAQAMDTYEAWLKTCNVVSEEALSA